MVAFLFFNTDKNLKIMETINLSFKNKKVTRTLPKRGLKRYRKIPVTEAKILETYSFSLPKMARNKDLDFTDFFILQVKDGSIDITDKTYILHYGIIKDIKDFKVYLHYYFYGKIVDVVIFEYKGTTEYGFLYNDFIYYQPDTIYYSNVFMDIKGLLLGHNFNRYYKLNEIKLQDVYVYNYDHTETKIEVDLNKMYYATALWVGEDMYRYVGYNDDRVKYVKIDEYNIDFLREFYVNKFNSIAIAEIKNTNNTDIVIK